MDLKSFEISKEMIQGKVVGMIAKRGCEFSSWIKFGKRCLTLRLEGVELCRENCNSKPIRLEWKEGGRVFKLELRSNNVGRFLQCSVWLSKGKDFP